MRTYPDPFTRRWTRRATSWSLVILSFIALLLLSPVWVPLCALIDVIFWRRVATLRGILFVFCYLFYEIVGLTLCFWAWIRHGRDPIQFRDAMYRAQFVWGRNLVHSATRMLGIRLHLDPQYEFKGRDIILVCRHCSIADTLVPLVCVCDKFKLHLLFVMKRELEWDPAIDVAVGRTDHLFVVRASGNAAREMAAIGDLIRSPNGDGVVIFPEGTRYTPAKRERILRKLEDEGETELLEWAKRHPYVLPPRTGGMLELLAKNEGADVVFLTHAGFEHAASFRQAFNGSLIDADIHINYWGVPYEDIPESPEDRRQWFLDQWSKVNAYVAEKL